jgi:hypothetical protein
MRSTTIVDVPSGRVRTLRIVAGAVRQELARSAEGASWTLREPTGEGLTADPTLAAGLAERLAKLSAVRWEADVPQPSFRLDEPWCTIEASFGVEPREPEPVDAGADAARESARRKLRLVLGRPTEGGYYAQLDDDPAVLVAPRGLAELACHWLVDRAALMVDPEAVVRVTLDRGRGDKPLVVEPLDGDWQVVGRGPSSAATGAQVREALAELMAEGVVHLGPPRPEEQIAKPLLRMELALRPAAGGKPLHRVLRVGAGDTWRDTSVFYVRREDLDATYAVAQARLRPLLDLF